FGFGFLFNKSGTGSPIVELDYRKFRPASEIIQVKFTNVNVGDFHAKPPKCGHSWGLRNIPRNRVLSSLNKDGALLFRVENPLTPQLDPDAESEIR
uniref:Uncharacterized protein n=1 Tax=Romanomermis culicivorax TaxID=13658 RepID=A0A915J5K4_ROMCU